MLILSNQHINGLLTFEEIIAAVEAAMISFEKKTSYAPKRMHIDNGNNTLLCMPSFNEYHFATKLVSVVPNNKEKLLPVTNGALLLNDAETGMPIALMNAAKLTALRTGALGAVGVKYIAPENIDTIGIIGLGAQGLQQVLFTCAIRPIKKVFALKRNESAFADFKNLVQSQFPSVDVIACHTAEEILENTSVIIAATTSATPILPDDANLLQGKHFISIGSYKPTMQELPDAVYKLAQQMAIDSVYARTETGDIINPIEKGYIKGDNVFTIGKLITGERHIDVNKTTVYKSAGMALFDLFAAEALYKKAIENNIGQIVEL